MDSQEEQNTCSCSGRGQRRCLLGRGGEITGVYSGRGQRRWLLGRGVEITGVAQGGERMEPMAAPLVALARGRTVPVAAWGGADAGCSSKEREEREKMGALT